jgi:hypothetical protein
LLRRPQKRTCRLRLTTIVSGTLVHLNHKIASHLRKAQVCPPINQARQHEHKATTALHMCLLREAPPGILRLTLWLHHFINNLGTLLLRIILCPP